MKPKNKILLNNHAKFMLLDIDEVNYIFAEGAYTKFFLSNHTIERSSKNIKNHIEIEHNKYLARISRSYVINIENILEIIKHDKEDVLVFKNQDELKLSKVLSRRVIEFMEFYFLSIYKSQN